MLQQSQQLLLRLQERLLREEDLSAGRYNTLRYFDAAEDDHLKARKAAVLLPLFEVGGELQLLFIRRSDTLRSHSGEIAFPGGGVETTDRSLVDTALREAREEIGLDGQKVEILGLLPPVFTVVSNFVIAPVVAYLPEGLGDLHLQTAEVQELILASLTRLADPAIARQEQWTRDGQSRTVYFYDYGQYCIWGATGRILNAFLERLLYDGNTAPPS